jgi:EAL domain-containing protein (putative c-di-GMP-specific phosphodiesterase class I)
MALIDGHPRTASARALTRVSLRRITREQLTDRLNAADPMLRMLLRGILTRYRDSLGNAPVQYAAADQQDRDRVIERLSLEQDLAVAVDRREFELHYQPIVRLSDLSTAGYEALIRWRSPSRGLVSPAVFIPVAEESSLIVNIGNWALGEACTALARMSVNVPPGAPLFMTVNLSGRQLTDPGLLHVVPESVRAAGVPPAAVKLEITESLLLRDFELAFLVLQSLRDEGFKVAVDDFGTGYSSLSYLHRFPVDTLKIDRAFVSRLLDDRASRIIVGTIGQLARALGMDVVAEGVETAAQAAALRELGFEFGQGYYFSRPVPEAEAANMASRIWAL